MHMDADFQCPITLELLEDPVTTECCGKTFSKLALLKTVILKPECPLCRANLSATEISDKPVNLLMSNEVVRVKNRTPSTTTTRRRSYHEEKTLQKEKQEKQISTNTSTYSSSCFVEKAADKQKQENEYKTQLEMQDKIQKATELNRCTFFNRRGLYRRRGEENKRFNRRVKTIKSDEQKKQRTAGGSTNRPIKTTNLENMGDGIGSSQKSGIQRRTPRPSFENRTRLILQMTYVKGLGKLK